MIDFTLRNLMLFFRDKPAVILSFLAEFVIVILYVFFMRDNLMETFRTVEDADILLDTWMMAGILGITSVSTTMGVYGIMVEDKARRIDLDFSISPVKRCSLIGGYLAGAFTVGLLMSVLLLITVEAYIYVSCGLLFDPVIQMKILGILVLNTVSNSMLVLLIVSFIKTNNALAACCTILGTLVGFLTGIYIPMGDLPQGVHWVVKCFPVSHGVVLLRQLLTQPLMLQSFGSVKGQAAESFMEQMGIYFTWDGSIIDEGVSAVIMSVTAAVCFAIANIRLMR